MKERSRVLGAALVGAVLGGSIGYLYFTQAGRRFLDELEPRLDRFGGELQRLRRTIGKLQVVASEGWRSLVDLAPSSERQSREWTQQSRQASPF